MSRTIEGKGRTIYNSSPSFVCDRPAMSDPLAEVIAPAAAARRVLEGHQRRRSLGGSLLGVRAAELLRRARGQLPPRGRRRGAARARGRRLRAAAGDARLHAVGVRAGDAGAHRPQGRANAPPAKSATGRAGGPADVRLLGGWFVFDSPDAALLVSLLPAVMHVRGLERLSVLVQLVDGEASDAAAGARPRALPSGGRAAHRSPALDVGDDAPPGLLRGLADARVARALRHMHDDPARAWTVAQLATKAALSRSAFYERFTRTVGLAPMEYLLAWRMALAKDLLRRQALGIAEVAERVGYGSASTFSTAFSRHVGQPPGRYAAVRTGIQ